jgi:type I restriction enzyme R subunit
MVIISLFTNSIASTPPSPKVFTFHRPEALIRLTGLDHQLRADLEDMPELNATGLWRVQAETVPNLDVSLAENRPRSLIQIATRSGKTFTACALCYRLIKFANAAAS